MLKRIVLATILTLVPLFSAVTTVKAASIHSILDIIRIFTFFSKQSDVHALSQPISPSPTPTAVPVVTLSPTPAPSVTITASPSLMPTEPASSPAPTISISPTPIITATPTDSPTPIPTAVLSGAPDTVSDSIKNYLMNEINSYRKSQGLSEVKTDGYTCSFAKVRAVEISTNFNHDGFTARLNSHSLPYPSFTKVTENIAMNSSYTKVIENWKKSPGHAENMRADTPFVCVEKYGNYYAYEGLHL